VVPLINAGDMFYPVMRSQRIVDPFIVTGTLSAGVTKWVLLVCPQAGSNPDKEGSNAVADAIPVAGAFFVFSGLLAATGGILSVEAAYSGGGSPSYGTILLSTAWSNAWYHTTLSAPVVPAIRFGLTHASAIAYKVAITVFTGQ
jgi:hypothetical protein